MTIDENRPQLDIWSTVTERRGRTIGGESAQSTVAMQIQAFIRDIREDRAPLYDVHDAWATIAAIEAAYRSLATGQPASVADVPKPKLQ
jgi:predicted dehydrogenase